MGAHDGDHQSRGAWHHKKWVAVAAVLIGPAAVIIVGVVVVREHLAAVSRAAELHSQMEDWTSRSMDPYTDLQNAMQSVSNVLAAHGVQGAQSACEELHGAAQRLGATLPSPDAAVTSEVQAGVDEISTASNSCLSSDLASAVQARIDGARHISIRQNKQSGILRPTVNVARVADPRDNKSVGTLAEPAGASPPPTSSLVGSTALRTVWRKSGHGKRIAATQDEIEGLETDYDVERVNTNLHKRGLQSFSECTGQVDRV
jgi:hypothetical protein